MTVHVRDPQRARGGAPRRPRRAAREPARPRRRRVTPSTSSGRGASTRPRSRRSRRRSPTGCARRCERHGRAKLNPAPGSTTRHRRVRGPVRAAGRRGAQVWAAPWPKLLAVAIVRRRLADRRLDRLEARVRRCPSPFTVFDQFWHDLSDHSGTATPTTLLRAAIRASSIALVIGVVDRRRSSSRVEDPARRRRLDDHRPADDAVGRVVPARDRAVRARARARSSSSSCSARRRRSPTASSTASTTSRRSCCAPAACSAPRGFIVVPPRRAPGRAAVVRRRPEAGLGVRVAQPARRRADRADRGQGLARAASSTARATSADYVGVYAVMIVIFIIGVVVDALVLRHRRALDPPPLRPDRRRREPTARPLRGRAPRPRPTASRRRPGSPCATSMPSTT